MTLYVVRRKAKIGVYDNHGSSAPCKQCTKLIKKCGIKKIKYLDNDNNLISINSRYYHSNHVSMGQTFLQNHFKKINLKYNRCTKHLYINPT